MKNRLIIFDCFGVVFREIAPRFFNNHFEPETAAILKEKYFVPADLGTVTSEELFRNMADELGIPEKDIREEWDSLISLNEDIIPMIKELGKTADVILLSNALTGFVERLFEEYNLNPLFDKVFISSVIKLAKPDPEIYRYCVKQMNKEYDEIYMIDDNLSNLAPLEQLGITPVHFISTESIAFLLDKE